MFFKKTTNLAFDFLTKHLLTKHPGDLANYLSQGMLNFKKQNFQMLVCFLITIYLSIHI